jgi:hypothetical protein
MLWDKWCHFLPKLIAYPPSSSCLLVTFLPSGIISYDILAISSGIGSKGHNPGSDAGYFLTARWSENTIKTLGYPKVN